MTGQDELMKEYQNDVWDIVLIPEIKNVVSSKWICKTKYVTDISKERIVARGFSQKEGIYYEETFAPVASYTSIKVVMTLASMMKWDLHQMDVKTNFLNDMIEEEYYIKQSQGFEVEDRWKHVCKLKKALYGLTQAPRAWYGRIYSFLSSMGFTKSKDDPNTYTNIMDDELVIVLLYMDDLFMNRNEKQIKD